MKSLILQLPTTLVNRREFIMIDKIEFVTEIYVDNDNDAMVAEFAFTEKASVDTAIASFNAMGFDAGTISKNRNISSSTTLYC